MDAVPGYKYTSNKFDWINNDKINLYSLGGNNISTKNIKQLSLDPSKPQDLEVTNISYGSYDEDPNSTPTSTGQGEGFSVQTEFVAVVGKEESINIAGEYQNSITNETSSTTETSDTKSEEFGVGVEVSYSAQVGPEYSQSTYSAALQSSYDQSWSSTETLSYTEGESVTNTNTVNISYSSTITPVPTTSKSDDEDALTIDIYNQKYTIEAGDKIMIDTTFAKGTYYAQLDAPYLLDGTVGSYTIGTATTTPGNEKIYYDAWQGGGTEIGISRNIGKAAYWATLYDWQLPFSVNEDIEITQYEGNPDQAYVQNASTATTGVGAYFVINTYKNGELLEGGGGSSSRSSRKAEKKEHNRSNISLSDKARARFKEIGVNKLPYEFNVDIVNDLSAELKKTAERLELSEDAEKTLPGYYIEQKIKGDSVIILPDRINHLDISESKGKNLILAESGRGRLATGSGNDIVATNQGSQQTIRTGSGADIVYSLGSGDNINVGNGKDTVYALGEKAFIKLGNGKNESIFLGDKSKVQLFDFKPGSTRLGSKSFGPDW